jgi:hypothetical protein
MELSLYSLCTDRRENSLLIVGTECLLNNCPATASYIVARTVESSPWQRCREVFIATLCSNQHAAARLGSARLGTARHGEDTALTIHVTLCMIIRSLAYLSALRRKLHGSMKDCASNSMKCWSTAHTNIFLQSQRTTYNTAQTQMAFSYFINIHH